MAATPSPALRLRAAAARRRGSCCGGASRARSARRCCAAAGAPLPQARAPLACAASRRPRLTPRARRTRQAPPRWRVEARGRVREYTLRPDGSVADADDLAPASAPSSAAGAPQRSGVADAARDFLLPPGFPGSVSGDYLRYAALSFPCHVTGALAGSLATAALLHGVGLGATAAAAGATAAPALSAAAKWVSKDGLGAAGRLVVAGRVAGYLDAEPRQWRLYAEAASVLGGALDVATALAPPAAFLPLAAAGTALRAGGKAVAAPAHQVILAHFARANNLGAVAAKEEVQEVLAQLLGLALSVALLQQPALKADPQLLAGAWAAVSGLHVALRAAALTGLRFPTLNGRRAAHAAAAHVAAEPPQAWAPQEALNAREAALFGSGAAGAAGAAVPRIALGTSLGDALRRGGAAAALPALAAALAGERFLLTWRGASAWVVLREGATARDALRATWLAAHLCADAGAASALDVNADVADVAAKLRGALGALEQRFADFEGALAEEGWDTDALLPPRATTPRLLDEAGAAPQPRGAGGDGRALAAAQRSGDGA
jgi:hypothetical protein